MLNGLFDEYLQSQGNWLESSLAVRLKQSSSTEALGEESMVPFKQLREQHGVNVARQMRHQKRQLQAKAKPGDLPFVMEHPDMPGCEVPCHDHTAYKAGVMVSGSCSRVSGSCSSSRSKRMSDHDDA